MNKQEFYERLQELHPDASMQRIIKAVNIAIRDFSLKTKILEGSFTQSLTENKRHYTLDKDIIEIISIDVDDKEALKVVGRPTERDME